LAQKSRAKRQSNGQKKQSNGQKKQSNASKNADPKKLSFLEKVLNVSI